jgi:hypothetical protein
MRVNEVSFDRIEEVHDCQNVTAIFESFQIMCYGRKNELIEMSIIFYRYFIELMNHFFRELK